ncbi:M16 family metallopeptidase [Desulfurobacterium atlanticum]|uniref:Predicted Zn-dependent peptidase n=1 Tax=Desulfurobacterium atlanticum TaxID=240169 RepID=A0A238ZAU7_9BACT|nr:pitrilysin family protein [Desulfurobacterium atlanticum]SNR79913.1 Predicted Zn-dependent peptidase [Desulfurobacterium atlanticum]
MEICKINGIDVIINPVDELDITSVVIFSENGSITDEKGKAGTTFLSLRVGLKRSEKKTSKEIAFITEPYGSTISPDTGKDFSTISFQTVSEGVSLYFEIFSELITEPAFTDEDFMIEKETLLASIRGRLESPFSFGYEHFQLLTYKGTPYENIPYGTLNTVVPITKTDIENRYKEFFKTGKFTVSISGKIPDGIEKLIENLPISCEGKVFVNFSAPIENTESVNLCRKGSTQTFILRGYEAPSVKNWEDYVAFKLLNTIVGEGFNSIMFKELREKKGLAYSTGSFFPSSLFTGRFVLYIGTSPDKEKTALKGMDEIIGNLPSLITEENLTRAKNYIEGTYLLDHETRLRKAWYCGWWNVLKENPDFDRKYLEKLKAVPLSKLEELSEKLAQKPYHQVIVCDG